MANKAAQVTLARFVVAAYDADADQIGHYAVDAPDRESAIVGFSEAHDWHQHVIAYTVPEWLALSALTTGGAHYAAPPAGRLDRRLAGALPVKNR